MEVAAAVMGFVVGLMMGAAMGYRSVHMTPDDKLIEVMIERRKRRMLAEQAEAAVRGEVKEALRRAPATNENDKS